MRKPVKKDFLLYAMLEVPLYDTATLSPSVFTQEWLNATRKVIKFIRMYSFSKGIIMKKFSTGKWSTFTIMFDTIVFASPRGIECCRIVFICLGVGLPAGRNRFRTDARSYHYGVCLVSPLHNSLFGSGSGTVQMWDVFVFQRICLFCYAR